MRRTNILYWVFIGLLAALMLFSAIPNIISNAQSVELISKHLGYPAYFIPFIGVAKLLGVIAILLPGFPRLKEWAYAGFMFDLVAAIYSSIAVGDAVANWLPMIIGPVLIGLSYFFYHKKLKTSSITAGR